MRLRRRVVTVVVGALAIAVVAGPAWGRAVAVPPVTAEDQARYGLVPVTEPEPIDRSELEHLAMLRRTLGVPRSLDDLRRLQADPVRFGALRSTGALYPFMMVTPDELPWLIERAQIDGQTGDGRRVAEAALGPAFAGSFPSGRHYVVQCAGCDVAGVEAQLAASDLPSPLREHIDVRRVRYSLADLERARTELDSVLAGIDVAVGAGTMIMDNRVQIDVGVGYPKLARLVRERFGKHGPVAVVRNRIDTNDPEPVSLSGARTDGRRGLVLSFAGAAPVTDRKDSCQLDYDATADEGRATVKVAVRPRYRAVHRAGGSGGCELIAFGRLVTVRLDRPLGVRTLVDAATGDPLPVFDGATRLRPQWLPAGWDLRGESAGGCWSSTDGACWSQTWGTPESEDPTTCVAGAGFAQLGQAPRHEGLEDDPIVAAEVVVTPAAVRGAPAEVLVDPRGYGSVTVRWVEGDQSFVLYSGTACAGADAPAADVVVRIADSLR